MNIKYYKTYNSFMFIDYLYKREFPSGPYKSIYVFETKYKNTFRVEIIGRVHENSKMMPVYMKIWIDKNKVSDSRQALNLSTYYAAKIRGVYYGSCLVQEWRSFGFTKEFSKLIHGIIRLKCGLCTLYSRKDNARIFLSRIISLIKKENFKEGL